MDAATREAAAGAATGRRRSGCWQIQRQPSASLGRTNFRVVEIGTLVHRFHPLSFCRPGGMGLTALALASMRAMAASVGCFPKRRQGINMKRLIKRFGELLNDQTGGEVIEYVLIAALISVAAITLIAWVGTKVAAKWTSVKSSL